jgi:hypothetical protein
MSEVNATGLERESEAGSRTHGSKPSRSTKGGTSNSVHGRSYDTVCAGHLPRELLMPVSVVRVVMPCELVGTYKRFGETYCLRTEDSIVCFSERLVCLYTIPHDAVTQVNLTGIFTARRSSHLIPNCLSSRLRLHAISCTLLNTWCKILCSIINTRKINLILITATESS